MKSESLFCLTAVIVALHLAGLGLLTMMLVTCADIILRVFRISCAVVVLVTLYHLVHPGQLLLKP